MVVIQHNELTKSALDCFKRLGDTAGFASVMQAHVLSFSRRPIGKLCSAPALAMVLLSTTVVMEPQFQAGPELSMSQSKVANATGLSNESSSLVSQKCEAVFLRPRIWRLDKYSKDPTLEQTTSPTDHDVRTISWRTHCVRVSTKIRLDEFGESMAKVCSAELWAFWLPVRGLLH